MKRSHQRTVQGRSGVGVAAVVLLLVGVATLALLGMRVAAEVEVVLTAFRGI